jgi:rhamnose transport system permease protein
MSVLRLLPLLRHTSWLLAGALLLGTVLSVKAFRELDYWVLLTHQRFAMAALALALTPIILTGGIDLSVGSVSVLSGVAIGALWQDGGWPLEWAFAGGVLLGLLAGLGNGLFVTLGIAPLVATLATRELYRGLAFTLSSAQPRPFPASLSTFWREGSVLGLPLPLCVFLFLLVLTYLVVHHTWIGRMLFALGSNEEAARFAAVPVRSLKFGLYAWAGLVAGLCGAVSALYAGVAPRANLDSGLELAAIACVVLGGVRITGGAGHVAGTLFGIVTMATLLGGLQFFRATWRDTLTGTLLVVVAINNEVIARWLERRPTLGERGA